MLITWQDYEKITKDEKAAFLLDAMNNYISSQDYQWTKTAITYYEQKNEFIMNWASPLERVLPPTIKFHKVPSAFYPSLALEWVFYTLGNGLSAPEPVKKALGPGYDMEVLLNGAIPGCHGGESYAFWDNDHVRFFGKMDGFPLPDERTNNLKGFVRFWQIDPEKPAYIEFFEIDGITDFKATGKDKIEQIDEIRPYKTKMWVPNEPGVVDPYTIGGEGYSELPIFRFPINDKGTPEFTESLKRGIDSWDAINSDQINSVLQDEGPKWFFQNYGGEDIPEIVDIVTKGYFKTNEDVNTSVGSQVVEAPYHGKESLLERIERRIYAGFMIPNSLQDGRAVTATEIKNATKNLNIKADILEWRACQLAGNILKLQNIKFEESELSYKRRSIIDDTEVINNLSTQLADGYIDLQKALEDAPNVADEEVTEILNRIEVAQKELADETFPFGQEEEKEGEEE